MTPPGSACSISVGTGITDAAPGSAKGPHLVVSDIEAARAELVDRGLEVSGIRHLESGEWVPGPDPQHRDYGSFADFSDPDSNTWVLQGSGEGAGGMTGTIAGPGAAGAPLDASLRAWRKRETFEGGSLFRAWLYALRPTCAWT